MFAISYDAPAVLRAFAAEHSIGYPLLSDEGSRVIRALGLLNERVQDDHAAYGIAANPRHLGVPYPGVFLLDAQGVVVRKRFHVSYRQRDTGSGLLAHMLDAVEPSPGTATAEAEGVRVQAWLDAPDYAFFQRLRLTVELEVPAGLHVYAAPPPEGAVGLALAVAPLAGLEVEPATWPQPRRLPVGGRVAPSAVHAGTVRAATSLTFTAPPGAGDQVVRATVRYQPCTGAADRPPASVTLELPVRERALVGRSLPPRTG